MTLGFRIGAHTFTNKKFHTEAEQEETHGIALVGFPVEGKRLTWSAWSGLECALGSLKDTRGWRWEHAVDPQACLQPQCLFLSRAEPNPRSEGQEGWGVEGV